MGRPQRVVASYQGVEASRFHAFHSSHELISFTAWIEKKPALSLVPLPIVWLRGLVVIGARQTGKSTLFQQLVLSDRRYSSLDDLDIQHAARHDPDMLFAGKQPVTLDEVQRTPELMLSIKCAIDKNRRAGRFLLTGSANLLMMQRVAKSLAGRASYLTLWPMTRREQGYVRDVGPATRNAR